MKKLLQYIRDNWETILGVVFLLLFWSMCIYNGMRLPDASVYYEPHRCAVDGFGGVDCY